MTLPVEATDRKAIPLIEIPESKKPGWKRKDYTGQRFGRRVVLGCAATDKLGRIIWAAQCDCGAISRVNTQGLNRDKPCRWCAHKGQRPWRRKRPFEAQYNNFVCRAKHPVEITYEEYALLATQHCCHYCNAPISWRTYRGSLTSDSHGAGAGSNLDRKDCKKGYSLENVVVCCRRCNIAKNTLFTYEEWKKIGKVIMEFAK